MANDLTRRDQEDIASLLHHPGYVKLLDLLANSERATLADAEDEADPAKLLRAMRFWQFLHKVHQWLKVAPGTIADELARLRQDGLLDPDVPQSRNDAWARRFAHVAAAELEEEFPDPASI